MDLNFWKNRRVAVTGHTGFKGTWLSFILASAGADVWGYALAPDTEPNLFTVLQMMDRVHSDYGDIRDREKFGRFIVRAKPSIVFHLAAQPLVRRSYLNPQETFETNVMGTANCLDLSLHAPDLEIVVAVTTDKCYANDGSRLHGFVETDPLGGTDPYSASKAAAEIVAASYRVSYYEPRGIALATARAGNVIGGGDWSMDRIFTDLVRSAFERRPLVLRNPDSIRPWQHVVDALAGYIALPESASTIKVGEPWNFAPLESQQITVREIVESFSRALCRPVEYSVSRDPERTEAPVLRLNADKARTVLGWSPLLTTADAIASTVEWYRAYYAGEDVESLMKRQMADVGR